MLSTVINAIFPSANPTAHPDLPPVQPHSRVWQLWPGCDLVGVDGGEVDLRAVRPLNAADFDVCREDAKKLADEFRQTSEFHRLNLLLQRLALVEANTAMTDGEVKAAKDTYNAALEQSLALDGDSEASDLKPLDLSALQARAGLLTDEKTLLLKKISEAYPVARRKLQAMQNARTLEFIAQLRKIESETREKLNAAYAEILAPMSVAATRSSRFAHATSEGWMAEIIGERPEVKVVEVASDDWVSGVAPIIHNNTLPREFAPSRR